MKKIVLFTLLTTLGFYSCIDNRHPGAVKTLHINLTKSSEIELSKIFSDKVEYISLSSNEASLIGSVSQVIIGNKYIAIVDITNSKAVFIYDKKGKLINKIYKPGNGPYEYSSIKYSFLNESENSVGVMSLYGKVVTYDIVSAKGINEYSIDIFATKFFKDSDNFLVSCADGKYNLYIFDANGQIKQKMLQKEYKFTQGYTPFSSFSRYYDTILFLPNLTQTFYKYHNGKLEPKYLVDFGENNISIKEMKSIYEFDNFIEFCRAKKYAHSLDNFYETDKFFQFSFMFNQRTYFGFFNKLKDTLTIASKIINDIDGLSFYAPLGYNNNSAIQVKFPEEISADLKILKEKMSAEEWSDFENKNKRLISIANKISPYDNPVLVFYQFK
jgi:hypothetical protein